MSDHERRNAPHATLSQSPANTNEGRGPNVDELEDERPERLFDWLTRVHSEWGMRQAEFARDILGGFTPNAMRGWRDGAMPEPRTLGGIASAVGVTVDDLHAVMRGEPVPTPPRPQPSESQPSEDGTLNERVNRLESRVDTLAFLLLEIQRELREAR